MIKLIIKNDILGIFEIIIRKSLPGKIVVEIGSVILIWLYYSRIVNGDGGLGKKSRIGPILMHTIRHTNASGCFFTQWGKQT